MEDEVYERGEQTKYCLPEVRVGSPLWFVPAFSCRWDRGDPISESLNVRVSRSFGDFKSFVVGALQVSNPKFLDHFYELFS